MGKDEEVYKSEIAAAIEQRERKLYEFDVGGFFSLGDRPVPRLAIRALTKSEENAALVAAHALAKEWARGDADTRSDADLLDDLKLKEALQRACFVAGKTTKGGHPIQAFPGGRWMEDHFTTEQIAVLHNLLLEVRRAESPLLWSIELADVMALAEGCAKTRDSDMPEALLASCSREYLTAAFTLLAGEWWVRKQKQQMIDEALDVHAGDEQHGGAGHGDGAGEAQPGGPGDVRDGEEGGSG